MKRLTFTCFSVTVNEEITKNMVVVLDGQQRIFIQKWTVMSANIKLLCTFTVQPAVALLKKQCRNRKFSLCIGNCSWNPSQRFKDVTVWITDSSTCRISHPTL